jgi:glycosyltransferase involved in cell wall biosynthesis
VISVVIRTRDEERWIGRCLRAVLAQDCEDFEVIVVDNESADNTLRIAKGFDCRVLTISQAEFSHGRSINLGVAAAKGDVVAILSGHCVPVNDTWLRRLAISCAVSDVAGVYGRQEPLPDTNDFDKRDLYTTFGTERRVQSRDYFFHNANSMIRRDVWESVPFNEELNGVEDRDWAKRVLELGHKVVYEPAASVYHFHGINHGRDAARAARVVRVIELIRDGAPNGDETS